MSKSERNWFAIAGVALLLFIAISLVLEFWLAPTIFMENKEAGENIAEDTIDSDVAVQEYREFRQMWFDIKALRAQLENYEQQEQQFHETYGDDPKEWPRDARNRHGRLHDRIVGTQNMIENKVAEYNAMTADATSSLYSCHLPFNIQTKLFIADGGGVKYKVDDPPETAPKAENLNGDGCKFAEAPTESGE